MATAMNRQMSKSGKKCKICKKRYEDPRLLPCLHTYCKACLERSVQTHNGKLYLICPVCQYKVTFSELSDVKKLPCNLIVSRSCENCKEETATSYCVECKYALCGNCVETHKQDPTTEKHEIEAIKKSKVDKMVKSARCATHPQEELEAFCKQCKKPVCGSCISGEHKKHSPISLEEAVDDINELLVERASTLESKLEEVYASKEKLESNVHDVEKEFQATFERILTAVKKRENDLYEWLKRKRDTKRDKLESKEQALKDDLAQVLQSCNLSEKEDHAVPETAESEIKYRLEEKPVLDTLKKCLQVIPTDFPEVYGTFPCGDKKCKTCSFIDFGTVISTKKSEFRIRHHFTCETPNLVYCISCSKCNLHYIGETGERLQTRFGEHRRSVENPKERERNYGVVEHFTSKGHNSSHMKVRALLPCPDKDETHPEQEETSPEQEEKRRKQEKARRKQEEKRRKEEEKRRKQEETSSEQEEKRRKEEEKRRKQEEKKRRKQEEKRLIVKLGTLYPSGLNKKL